MADCPVCENMIEQMCKASDDKEACKGDLDKLEDSNVFESMVKSDVFNEDFREDVKKGVMGDDYEPPEPEKPVKQNLRNDLKGITNGMKPLSIKNAVKDSYNILRGRT